MNSSNNIVISVVMPVYNGRKYLKEAIDSILGQTFDKFEFIIINDGSTDDTAKILDYYQDGRIVRINNEKNLGLSKSFNIGIKAAQGQFIARMDADDISAPDRFEKQIFFLHEHSEIGIVGSAAMRIDENGEKMGIIHRPSGHLNIKWRSLFSTPVLHPTVFAKAEVLKNNPYDENLHNSEDYELWSRLLFEKSVYFHNINEPLIKYRVFDKSFTQSLDRDRKSASTDNTIKNIERYAHLTDGEKTLIIRSRQGEKLSISELYSILNIYKKAQREFKKIERFNPSLTPLIVSLIKYGFKHYLR